MQDESQAVKQGLRAIPVKLEDGTICYVQVKMLGGESNVGIKAGSFDKVTQAIEGIAHKLNDVWKKVEPSKVSVELGVDFAWESGEVVALFVDSSVSASMKITLEWDKTSNA